MEDPHELRERAKNYRRLALAINDRQTVKALRDLAEEYEALAARLEANRPIFANGTLSDGLPLETHVNAKILMKT